MMASTSKQNIIGILIVCSSFAKHRGLELNKLQCITVRRNRFSCNLSPPAWKHIITKLSMGWIKTPWVKKRHKMALMNPCASYDHGESGEGSHFLCMNVFSKFLASSQVKNIQRRSQDFAVFKSSITTILNHSVTTFVGLFLYKHD